MTELSSRPLPPGHSIRITAPASVLYDLDVYQRARVGVLGSTKCPDCTSGLNLIWQAYTEFAVDPARDVRPGQAVPADEAALAA